MSLIEFKNLPNATTPINASNLNNNFNELKNEIDEIVEFGNNENGQWIKFFDGTMICYKRFAENFSVNNHISSFFGSDAYYSTINSKNYPIAFTELNYSSLTLESAKPGYGMFLMTSSDKATNEKSQNMLIISPSNVASVELTYDLLAIGKWK